MDFKNIAIFQVAKKRLEWLSQRQEVLAQNISNSDTPGYRAKDLRPFKFGDLLRRDTSTVNLTTTHPDHVSGNRRRIRDFDERVVEQPFETSPDGNSVVLEEQMANMNETNGAHRLTTELYKKHLQMIRTAVRGAR